MVYFNIQWFILYFSFLVVTCTAHTAHNLKNLNKPIEKISKRAYESSDDESSDECKYINNWIKEDKNYNCCKLGRIVCNNGHIVAM